MHLYKNIEVINIAKTTCIICGKIFTYKSYKKKCCGQKCLSEYRRKLSTAQHNLDYDKVVGKIENHIVDIYKKSGIMKTLEESCKETHISVKTFYKYAKQYNISYNDILFKNNISKPHSKFQTAITSYVKQYYADKYHVYEEKIFKDCINPNTNYPLRFDIFISDINTAIECDGTQHNKKDSYYNNLVLESGHTPTYITDEIKEKYCQQHNIKLIRIPYIKCVTKEYVESFLCA